MPSVDLFLGPLIQCAEAATLGMPFEVWKTRMGRFRQEGTLEAFANIYKQGGVKAFWAGTGPKMIESEARCVTSDETPRNGPNPLGRRRQIVQIIDQIFSPSTSKHRANQLKNALSSAAAGYDLDVRQARASTITSAAPAWARPSRASSRAPAEASRRSPSWDPALIW